MKGETLKNFLRGRGFSNKWIADRLQMTDQNLSQLLAKDDIRTSLLERIAEAIGTTPAEIYGGHVTAKTGHLYDIKIEPETRALLDKYKGRDWLLCIRDRYKSARDYTQHINAGLKRLIPEPPFNKLSTYWARHSWATIAFNELGASVETISTALGHRHGSRITAIYINPDTRKVDELNRQLLDLLFK